MRMTLYRSILRQALQITWQYKYLWFFGLFATLLASNFEVDLVSRFLNQGESSYGWQKFFESGLFSSQAWHGFWEVAHTDTSSFIGILILLLVLAILALALLWLSVVSQAALVNNSNKALLGTAKKAGSLKHTHDVSLGFQEGNRYFWPVLGINIIVQVALAALGWVTLVPFLIWVNAQGLGFGLVYLVVFIIFISVALSLALMARYAIASVVLKGQKVTEALGHAWQLFWSNWLVSLEMAFILFATSLVATFFIILAVLIVTIPFVVLYLIMLYFGWYLLWVLMLILAILLSIAIVIIGGSMVTVFQTTAWVGLYNQLTGKGISSKLERMFGE